jgi:hypothetical protein
MGPAYIASYDSLCSSCLKFPLNANASSYVLALQAALSDQVLFERNTSLVIPGQLEYRVLCHRYAVKFTCKSSFEHRACMVDIHAFSDAMWPTATARMDQPAAEKSAVIQHNRV